MERAAATASESYLKAYVFAFVSISLVSDKKFHSSRCIVYASVRFREEWEAGRGTRPTRSSRSDSHGKGFPTVSLRFAYGWVRKSANEQEASIDRCIERGRRILSSLENGARSWDRSALITQEEEQLRLSLSLFLRYTAFPSSIPFYCLSTATVVHTLIRRQNKYRLVRSLVIND